MKITTAEFVKGITGTDPILKSSFEQVAFVGRSNVGKSSVINSLTGRKNLVKSSGEPGKTKEINFFLINKNFYFADLPGYGFAKLPFKKREKLRKLIIWYLTYSDVRPKWVVLIIDAHVGVTALDREMISILTECSHPFFILANKVDRIPSSKRVATERAIRTLVAPVKVLFYSAKSGEGKEEVLRALT
jgi:GTP-binding protein